MPIYHYCAAHPCMITSISLTADAASGSGLLVCLVVFVNFPQVYEEVRLNGVNLYIQ